MLLLSVYIIAIIAEAITGALAAGKYKMDLFGVILISLVTALGGGTIRDILLDTHPLTWVVHPHYILLLICFSVLTMIVPYFIARFDKAFLLLDALGLVAFSIIGVDKALSHDFGLIICIVAGVTTGVFGGILRDIFCNRIPLVFQKEVYAGVSIIACILYYLLLKHTSISKDISIIITLIFGFAFRSVAIYYKLGLPVFIYDEEAKRVHNVRKIRKRLRAESNNR